MLYWSFLIMLFVSVVGLSVYLWKRKMRYRDIKRDDFIAAASIEAILFVLLIVMSIDIPCALKGGKEIYTNELPTYSGIGMFKKTVTDNEELRHLNGINWDIYEKNGNYRIRYADFTNIVLSIEKLD